MTNLAQRMESELERVYTFMVQGQGPSRTRMLERFKQSDNGVLFGTDSFWTGVDVPGEAFPMSSSPGFHSRFPIIH